MKIEKLIEIFQLCLPHYKEAVNKKFKRDQLRLRFLDRGLCKFSYQQLDESLTNVMFSYYDNYIKSSGYMFKPGNVVLRLEFLKKEITSLKKLQKQGYTDV